MFVPLVAESFQTHNITALVYDPRHLGVSDGTPRSEPDPASRVSDYSDALTYLRTSHASIIDPARGAFWGMFFSATIALCAASLDPRAKAVIAAAPFFNLTPPPEKLEAVLAKCMRDRESRMLGNTPTYLPMLTSKGTNPAGLRMRPTEEEIEMVRTAQERGAVKFENRCTLETHVRFVRWRPEEVMRGWRTPDLGIVPGLETWESPERQKELFEGLGGIKEVRIVEGKGHFSLFGGEGWEELVEMQADFLERVFAEELG